MFSALRARVRSLHFRLLLGVPLLLASLIPSAQPVAASPMAPGVLTGFSGGGIYLSPDGTHLGGGGSTSVPYVGEPASALLRYQRGNIVAFDSGNIYYTPDDSNMHGGGHAVLLYGGPGAQQVRAMTTFRGGVMTAFSGGGIYWSPDGTQYLVGGPAGTRPYLGVRATALQEYGSGVIAAFEDGQIYYSPDGQNLHGGGSSALIYGGTQQVRAMSVVRGGVLTAFSGGGIYWSPDPTHYLVGGPAGTRPYLGTRATALLGWASDTYAAFDDGQIYFSPDGLNLHGGGASHLVYGGTQLVRAISPSVDLVFIPPQLDRVPNCIGLSEGDCLNQLAANGLVAGNLSFWVPSGNPPYVPIVINQSPAAGALVPQGSPVDLTIQPQGLFIPLF